MIDTHCHLNFKAFEKDLDEVVKRAKEAGVEKIIIPGAKIDSSEKAVKIAGNYDGCFAAIGIHPHHTTEYYDDLNHYRKCISSLRNLAQQKKVVAIGEIGLDYHQYKDYPPITTEIKEKQKELFLAQIILAQELNLPVIIHCREAWDDLVVMLYNITTERKIKGVLHCFSGAKEDLEKVLEMGFFVGFDGNITYPENENLRELVKLTPLDRLLLETDSPYLSPEPYRGQRNEPKNIKIIMEFVAGIKKVNFKILKEQLVENCNKFRNYY